MSIGMGSNLPPNFGDPLANSHFSATNSLLMNSNSHLIVEEVKVDLKSIKAKINEAGDLANAGNISLAEAKPEEHKIGMYIIGFGLPLLLNAGIAIHGGIKNLEANLKMNDAHNDAKQLMAKINENLRVVTEAAVVTKLKNIQGEILSSFPDLSSENQPRRQDKRQL